MGTMTKAEKMRPNDSITRQEAFTILARAYKLEDGVKSDLAGFKDGDKAASYAVGSLGALLKAGYISGSNGVLNPTGFMTRGEFAKVMDSLASAYVGQSGEYSKDVTGNLVVNASGAVLKDMNVKGNIIIAEGVGEGDVDLENVTVEGDILVKAGGDHSIHLKDVTVKGKVLLAKVGKGLRMVASGDCKLPEIKAACDAIVDASAMKEGATIGKVKIEGQQVKNVKLEGSFGTVENAVKGVNLQASGTVEKFIAKAEATVTGGADIKKVENQCNKEVKVNDKVVQPEKKAEGTAEKEKSTEAGAAGGGSGSGGSGSGGGNKKPALTDEQKLASDKEKIEQAKISISLPYGTDLEDVKKAVSEKAKDISGLYNTNWEVGNLEGYEKGISDKTIAVIVSFKLGEVVTQDVKVQVYVQPMTLADKRALDREWFNGLEKPIKVSVGYYATENDVKTAIEEAVKAETTVYCKDWTVTNLDGFESQKPGEKRVKVKLTSGDVKAEDVIFLVKTWEKTADEKRAEDKAFLELENGTDVKVGNLETEDEAKEKVLAALTGVMGIQMDDWTIVSFEGFTQGEAGTQSVQVKFTSGDVTTDVIIVNVIVAELTAKERIQAQRALLEKSADSFAVTVLDTDGRTELDMALYEKIHAVASGWCILEVNGFKPGEAGTQDVTIVLECEEEYREPTGDVNEKTSEIPVKVTVKKLTDDEKMALDKSALETGLAGTTFTIWDMDDEEVLKKAIYNEGSKKTTYFDWEVESVTGFSAGQTGNQQIKVVFSCNVVGMDPVETGEIAMTVCVKEMTVDEKVASDKSYIDDMYQFSVCAYVPYDSSVAAAKEALANTINNISGMYYTDWVVTDLTGYDKTDSNGLQKVGLTLTSASAGKTISTSNGCIEVMEKSVSRKFAEDKAKLEAAGTTLGVTVGSSYNLAKIKEAVEEKASSVSGLNYSDWKVDSITGLTVGTPGTYNTKVKLTNSKRDGSEETSSTVSETTGEIAVTIIVAEKSDAEKIDHDKAILEGGSLNSKLGITLTSISDTGDQVAAAIAEKLNALTELEYHSWEVEMLGAQYGDAYKEGIGTQDIDVILKAGNVSVWLQNIHIAAPEPSKAEKLAVDKKALEEDEWNIYQNSIFADEINESAIIERVQWYAAEEICTWFTDCQWKATITGGKENIRLLEHTGSYTVKVVLSYEGVSTSEITVTISYYED